MSEALLHFTILALRKPEHAKVLASARGLRVAAPIIADYFGDKSEVAAVYLFGSVAKGTARADSDVDVGVLYQSVTP